MKTLITAPLLVISSAFAGDITNFGATMPNGDDYSTPFPYWLIFYFFAEYGFVRIKIVPCMAGRMNIQLFQ